jgi:C4-dicarboxylate-specific signal transduction histidine kinase
MDRVRSSSVQLILSPVDPELKVSCRKVQLSQVIINLICNSVDAVKDLSESWIKINVLPMTEKVQIQVIDSGNGIEPSVLKKLFQPFHTTKEAGKGTGLGLSISKNIVESHQGELRYQLNNGNTSFVMELPLVN